VTRLLTAALAVSALVACGGGAGGGRWTGTIKDSAGVKVVTNPAEGMWGPGEGWQLKEELRIGALEGKPEYQFGQITGVAVLSDGRIVVLDGQARELKLFSHTGTYERTIGEPGGGPGELGSGVSAVLVAPGDTILVSDLGNQRANLYLPDGTFVRSFPLNFAHGIPTRWESSSDGRIITQIRHLAFPGSTAPPDTMDAIMVRNLDGSAGDTLMQVPSGKTIGFSGNLPEWNLFSPEPVWALHGDRILYAVNDQYRIGVYQAGGALERVIVKPFSRDAVTEEDQQAIKDVFRAQLEAAPGVTPSLMPVLMSRLHFAAFYPAFAQVLGGPGGTILVQQIQAISTLTPEEREAFNIQAGDIGSRQWDVFDTEGRLLGTVTMPPRFQPARFRDDAIYGVQRDELDVQYVVRLRIVKG
jgi:hypothetical protein